MSLRIALLLSFLGLTTAHGSWAKPPDGAHPLDGKTFYGRERVKGGEERNQIYIFKDGTFEARWWAISGFQPGPYTATVEGDAILFTAETTSKTPNAGPAHWQGKVVGNHVEVTGVITSASRPPVEVSGKADLGERVRDAMLFEQQMEVLKKHLPPGSAEPEQILRQAQTVGDIRNLGTALYTWLTDQVPQLGLARLNPGQTVDLRSYPLVTAEQVRQRLVPTYLQNLNATDEWGHPIEMRVNLGLLQGKHVFCLRSPGRDGKVSGDSYTVESFPSSDLDQDIVWCDGYFVRWPESAQKPAGAASPH